MKALGTPLGGTFGPGLEVLLGTAVPMPRRLIPTAGHRPFHFLGVFLSLTVSTGLVGCVRVLHLPPSKNQFQVSLGFLFHFFAYLHQTFACVSVRYLQVSTRLTL
jgi:hypothetical protein